jgi:hypothetical protein
MRSLLRAFVVALVAVCALGAAVSASASALPRFAVAKGGSYPITAEASAPSAFAVISQATGEAHSCNGVDSQITIPALGSTASYAIELLNCKLANGLGCATEGSAGERLSGTATLVYINKASKLVGLLVTLTPTEILCGALKEKVKGSFLAPITPINKETTSLGLSLTGNREGKPTYTTYENEKSEASKAKLEVNYGAGYKEAALETEELTLSTSGAKWVTVQAEIAVPPENTGLPVVSPTTPVQGTLEAATHGTWANEPTSYTYQWERCNAAGEGCEPISGASGSTYTPVAGDVGHALVVKVTAKNEAGSTSARSKATGAVLAAGKPEFALGEGSVFPDAFAGGAPAAKVSISNPVEALTCEGATAGGSVTGAKSLSLTIELKRCANAKSEECKTPGAGAGVEILSGTGGLFYIAKAEKRAGAPFALTATEIVCGALKVKVRGTIVIPISPLNAKTTKLTLPFTGNGSGSATYTTYENEKGEVIKAKLEANFGSGYKESALELAETLEPTASEAFTITA